MNTTDRERRADTITLSNDTMRRIVMAGNMMQGWVGREPVTADDHQALKEAYDWWERALFQLRKHRKERSG